MPKKTLDFKVRNDAQRQLISAVKRCDLVLAVGAAGTGKSHGATALALEYHRAKAVHSIIISRPIVEAGEHLGYLPGRIDEKVAPYMQPIYDVLRKLAPEANATLYTGAPYIELSPLAYARGRTFSDAFVILDECQNATLEQLELFVTRLGEGSKMVLTGDPSQSDIANPGLPVFMDLLRETTIPVVEFTAADNLRHPLVQQLVTLFTTHRQSKGSHAAVGPL